MVENIENAVRELVSAFQVARLYPASHPQVQKAADRAFLNLEAVLKEREELVLGIIGEELAYEKEIFFELSKMVRPTIVHLKERGIERLAFLRGLEAEELKKFFVFLSTPKEEVKGDPKEILQGMGVKNITVGKIKVQIIDEDLAKAVNYLSVYEDSKNRITESLETVLDDKDIDQAILRYTITNVMEKLLGHYQEFLTFAMMKRHDIKTFFHVLNVSLLSMFFSSKLGFSKEEIIEIGTAALFHDIGKLYISKKIIQKPERLTQSEFFAIKNHVIIGTEILLKYVDTLGMLPLVVCFEHHLKFDLSGYPKVSFYKEPHIVSQIVSLCDIYDALSQRRGYKADYPPESIYKIILRERGTSFNPELFDSFFRAIGVWPVGTIVALSDERVAVVRKENDDDIFSPEVEVVYPPEQKELVDLRRIKERCKIEQSLNPLTDGKRFLYLV